MNAQILNHYYWFYSTVVQSLAALIGVVGVFAIFRLQVQNNIIEKRRVLLHDMLCKKYFMSEELYVDEKWLLANANKAIEDKKKNMLSCDKDINNCKNEMASLQKNIDQNHQSFVNRRISILMRDLKDKERDRGIFEKDKFAFEGETKRIEGLIRNRSEILLKTKIFILFLLFNLGLNISMLLNVQSLAMHVSCGNVAIGFVYFLLIIAGYFLYRLCKVSLAFEE